MSVETLTASVVDLAVAYRDACAADLGLFLDLPGQEALLARRVDAHGWSVELRILGASHQVLATRGDVLACSETLACRPDDAPGDVCLPRRHHQPGHDVDYAFASRTELLDPAEFRHRVDDLVDSLPGTTHALCARFPGDARATTGLHLESTGIDELRWSGWHSYPATGEVVTTSSRLVVLEALVERDR